MPALSPSQSLLCSKVTESGRRRGKNMNQDAWLNLFCFISHQQFDSCGEVGESAPKEGKELQVWRKEGWEKVCVTRAAENCGSWCRQTWIAGGFKSQLWFIWIWYALECQDMMLGECIVWSKQGWRKVLEMTFSAILIKKEGQEVLL